MAKKITRQEIAENDIFGDIRESADETIAVIDKLSAALTETAEAVKKSVGGAKFDSTKAIDNFVKSTEKANKLQKQAIELDKAKADAVKKRSQALAANQKNLQEQEKTVQQRLKTDAAQAKEKERVAKASERAAKMAKAENSEYTKLVVKTRDLKNQSKELAARMLDLERNGKRNTTAYRDLSRQYNSVTKEAKAGDKALKDIDSTVGDNFRNVGNYTGALKQLGASMATLAGGFGVMSLIRGATDIVVNFDQAQADLLAISGKTASEMAGLTAQAKELGATTQFSATQITEMQIELAKLGFSTDEIENSTAAIGNFAAATGADIPAAAALAGSALRAFGLDSSEMARVTSVMGVATTKTALDFSKLETGLSTVAPVAKSFGFSIEDTTALLGQLANSGFDASSAATATRNILLNLADANGDLAQQLGRPIESADDLAAGLQELQARGIDLGEALELTDKRSVAAFQTFLDGSDQLVELRDSITDVNDELEDMAAKRLDTIGGQFTLLESAWEGFILSVNEGTGVGETIKSTIGFIANNLTQIVSVLGSAIMAWGIYRTTLLGVKAANFVMTGGLKEMIGGLKNSVKGIFAMDKATKTAGQTAKGFGSALKGIPFILIITALIEVAKAFWDIATGARQAAEAAAAVDKIQELAAKTTEKRTSERAKALQQEMEANERLIRQKKKTEAEVRQLNEQAIKRTQDQAKSDRKAVNDRAKALQEDLDFLQRYAKKWNGIVLSGGGMSDKSFAESMERLGFKELAAEMRDGSVDLNDFNKMITVTEGKISANWKSWKVYNEEVEEYGFQMEEAKTQTFETAQAQANVTANTKNIREETKRFNTEFKGTIDLLTEYNSLMKERRDLENDIAQILMDRQIDSLDDQIKAEMETQRTAAETTGFIDVDLLEELIAKKTQMKKDAVLADKRFEEQEMRIKYSDEMDALTNNLEQQRSLLATGAMNFSADKIKEANGDKSKIAAIQKELQEDLLAIDEQYQSQLVEINAIKIEMAKNLEAEITKIHLDAADDLKDIDDEAIDEQMASNDELIDLQIAYANKSGKVNLDAAKNAKDAEGQMWEDRMQMAQVATDFLNLLSDKRIAKLDKEIDAAQKQSDFLRDLAANGNIDAKESLAEQQRIIDEANRKKIQEEKLKAKIEFANTVFQTYGQKVQAGSDSPLTDTIKDVSLLQQFIAQFTPTFKDGTEDTGSHGAGIDGQGGFHAILHPNERVLTKEQNRAIGGLSNDALAKVAQDYQNGKIMQGGASQIGNGWDTAPIVQRLLSLEKVIKEKPEHDLRVEDVVTGAMTIVRQTTRGNNVQFNRYKVKK